MPAKRPRKRRLHHAITNGMTVVFILCVFVLLTSVMRDDWNTAMASIVTGSTTIPALAYVRFLVRPHTKPKHLRTSRAQTRKRTTRPTSKRARR